MPPTLASPDQPARCEVSASASGVLALRLEGSWKMVTGIPDPAEIQRLLQAGTIRQVTFDTSSLADWDSAFLGYLLPIATTARSHQATLDDSGLPEGARKLLGMALAQPVLPKSEGAGTHEGYLTVLARMTERWVKEVVGELGFLGEFTQAFSRIFRGQSQLRWRDFLLQLQECGAEALPIVVLIGFLVGAIIGFVGATVLETYGAAIYTANMVAIAIARELGALMTAIILSGRTGAAFAANLGTMRTNEEIDALQTVGLNPIDFLVVPRVVALCIMIPLLTAFADLAGITGGLLVATTMPNVTFASYINATLKALTVTQVCIGLGKSVLFGAIIALVGCRRGLECGRSAAAVGLATTSSVVVSITLVIAVDGLLAVVFNALGI
ncbi:MAG: ABC transporter permease [Verrucomicrobia bacterium]|nr:ABC transporter permease [Verrucomicrobiota bacterium]